MSVFDSHVHLTKNKGSEHITAILISLNWFPVSYRIDFKALPLVFKSLNGLGPTYLFDLFQWYNPAQTHRSQANFVLVHPSVKSKSGEIAFS